MLFNAGDLTKLANNLDYVACGTATKIPKPFPQLTTVAYTLLITATPLVLIVFSIITLVKAIMSGNIEDVTKAKGKLLKKVIIAVIIFLVAGLVQYVLNRVTTNDDDKNSMATCMKCFLYFNDKDCPKVEYGGITKPGTYHRTYSNQAQPVSTSNKSNSNNNSSNNNGPTGNSNVIIVGDSRTVQFCNVIEGKRKDEYNGEKCGDFTAVARGGMAASWFKNTAISNVNNILKKDTSKKYTIVILMGANDVGETSGAEKNSVNIYQSKLPTLAKNDWKNHIIKFAKTTCGDQAMANSQQYPMHISQSQIDSFNSQIKTFITNQKISNLHYCDIEDVPRDQLSDGVHYKNEGSKFYYNQVKSKCA